MLVGMVLETPRSSIPCCCELGSIKNAASSGDNSLMTSISSGVLHFPMILALNSGQPGSKSFGSDGSSFGICRGIFVRGAGRSGFHLDAKRRRGVLGSRGQIGVTVNAVRREEGKRRG